MGRGQWVRNNPEAHPVATRQDFSEELGDVIMMLMVAGLVDGVDPLDALYAKMERKLNEMDAETRLRLATFTSNLEKDNGSSD